MVVDGGLRAGGRRVSRRISELLENLEGESKENSKSGEGGSRRLVQTSALAEILGVSNKFGFSTLGNIVKKFDKSENKIKGNVVDVSLFSVGPVAKSGDCDWLPVNNTYKLSTNEKPGILKNENMAVDSRSRVQEQKKSVKSGSTT